MALDGKNLGERMCSVISAFARVFNEPLCGLSGASIACFLTKVG